MEIVIALAAVLGTILVVGVLAIAFLIRVVDATRQTIAANRGQASEEFPAVLVKQSVPLTQLELDASRRAAELAKRSRALRQGQVSQGGPARSAQEPAAPSRPPCAPCAAIRRFLLSLRPRERA